MGVDHTNALPVVSQPALCRLVDCQIGGFQEIENAIALAGVDIIARRTKAGVVTFGRDIDVRKTFEPFGISAFETYPLSSRRLQKETGERALLREALFRALAKISGLHLQRRGRTTLLTPEPTIVHASVFSTDRIKPIDRLSGTVPKTAISWTEACAVRVDYRLDRLWLLLDPTVVTDIPNDTSEEHVEQAREFIRERRARRHNRGANAILDGWITLIVGRESSTRLRVFDIADGIDAEFEILRTSGFSGIARR
jgi:hypothetical protein